MKRNLLVLMLLIVSIVLQAQTYSHLVYAISDEGSPRGFSKLDLDDVTNYETLYEQSGIGTEWRSSTWMNGEWLALLYFDDLYKVDIVTGIPTSIVSITNGEYSLMGLTYDPVSENLYTNDVENLYTINVNTGIKSVVGALGAPYGVGGMFGLSCDHEGNLYGLNTNDDNLYSIDPLTGAATIIGSLGANVEYFISLTYDQDNHIMYASGYNQGGDTYGIFEVNLNTGLMTLYQEYTDPLAFRVNSIAIPYDEVLSIEDLASQDMSITIFPNPAQNTLNVRSENVIESLVIYNNLGQEITRNLVNSKNHNLDISNLQTGFYIVNFSINGIMTSYNFIKE